MNKSNKNKEILKFLQKLETHVKDASSNIDCLADICKNESRQIQRTISFVDNNIVSIRGLIWEEMEKYE